MSIPKSTVLVGQFGLDGKLTQELVSDALAANHFKSWLFLLSPEDESNPSQLVKDAGLEFANIPVPTPHGLTDSAARSIIDCLRDMPKPIMIQCSSGARASAVLLLYLQEKVGLTNMGAFELAKNLELSFLKNEQLVKWVGANQCRATHGLIFRQLFEEKSCTYTYLLGDPETRIAVIIDPVLETVERDAEVIKELDLDLQYAVNTHCHADHVTGTGKLKTFFPSLKSGIAAASGASADIFFSPGDLINFGLHNLIVKPTPGHTNGCISYYTESNGGMVFTGDALLIRGCGRTDFQEGDAETLYKSIHEMIFTLPDDTTIYPGHDYKGRTSSTVWEEKKYNPRLTKSKDEFKEIMAGLNLSPPRMIDVAVPANIICGIED